MAAKDQPRRSPQQAPPPSAWPAWAALAGVGLVLVVNLAGWSGQKKDQEAIEGRFRNLEASVQQLSAKVADAAKAARPPRQGPDPDKVYTVKASGAPAKGRVGAPILIAEFSDFQ
jgi:hypothetical protein